MYSQRRKDKDQSCSFFIFETRTLLRITSLLRHYNVIGDEIRVIELHCNVLVIFLYKHILEKAN